MRFYFSTWPQVLYQSGALTRLGANHRLLSFYYLRKCPAGFLEQYLHDGYVLSDEQEKFVTFLAPATVQRRK